MECREVSIDPLLTLILDSLSSIILNACNYIVWTTQFKLLTEYFDWSIEKYATNSPTIQYKNTNRALRSWSIVCSTTIQCKL